MTRRDWTPEELAALTEPVGYGSKAENFDTDPQGWLDSHAPALTLRCQPSGEPVALVWHAPDGTTHYRSGPYRGETAWYQQDGLLPVVCPQHGRAVLPLAYVQHQAASKRPAAPVLCTTPRPVYRAP